MALLQSQQHGRPSQQTPAQPISVPGSSNTFSVPPPSPVTGSNPDGSAPFTIDPSVAAKQMAALSAVGMQRMAQTGRVASASSSSGGPTSAGLFGGMPSLNQPHHSPISAPGHDPLSNFSQQGRPFQAQPGLNNSLPQHLNVNPGAGFSIPSNTDPILAVAAQMASSNQPHPHVIQAFQQKRRQFFSGLANIHVTRGAPLPPPLTGMPWPPGYDPNSSPWKMLETSSTDVGSIRLAGKDVDLFKLWTTVYRAGGGAKLSQQHAWPSMLPHFDLPDTFPIPQPNMPSSVAEVLSTIYMRMVFPFEQMYSRGMQQNQLQQQQRAAMARAQGGQFSQPGHSSHASQMGGPDINMQTMMGGGMPQGGGGPMGPSLPSGPIPPQLARQASGSSTMSAPQSMGPMPSADAVPGMPPNLGPQFSGLPHGGTPAMSQHTPSRESSIAFEADFDNRKRKMGMEEDAKRARQKTTEPPDAMLPTIDRTSVPPTNMGAAPASGAAMAPSHPQARGRSQRRNKVEYVPLRRELDTAGGRDLRQIMEEHQRAAARRPMRDINEWGNVDVDSLTMSVRSRISTELSYSLTTLTLLSIMRGQGGAGFPIGGCEDLMEELLDLLEEAAFGTGEDQGAEDENTKIVTNKELVSKIVEDGSRPFAALDKKQGSKAMELGPKQRPGDIVLAIMNIFRNLSVVPDNQEFLANHERMLSIVTRLCGLAQTADNELRAASPALALNDLVAVRRDVLYLFINLAGLAKLSPSLAAAANPSPTALRIAKRTFELLASYLVDPSETVTPIVLIMQSGVSPIASVKPPQLVDAALEVFTRLGQPDINRQVISKAVPQAWQRQLFEALVYRLPLADHDFQIAVREVWLSYVEKVIMALYALAFLAPPELKQSLKDDRRLGFSKVMLRLVKKFTINVPGDVRTYFNVCAKRAIEAMKVLDDGEDAFDTTQSVGGPVLSFGVGYGEVGEDRVEKGTGMLGGFQEDVVWGVMLQKDVDEGMFRELESLARVG